MLPPPPHPYKGKFAYWSRKHKFSVTICTKNYLFSLKKNIILKKLHMRQKGTLTRAINIWLGIQLKQNKIKNMHRDSRIEASSKG